MCSLHNILYWFTISKSFKNYTATFYHVRSGLHLPPMTGILIVVKAASVSIPKFAFWSFLSPYSTYSSWVPRKQDTRGSYLWRTLMRQCSWNQHSWKRRKGTRLDIGRGWANAVPIQASVNPPEIYSIRVACENCPDFGGEGLYSCDRSLEGSSQLDVEKSRFL